MYQTVLYTMCIPLDYLESFLMTIFVGSLIMAMGLNNKTIYRFHSIETLFRISQKKNDIFLSLIILHVFQDHIFFCSWISSFIPLPV
jgi:hypothetical protein